MLGPDDHPIPITCSSRSREVGEQIFGTAPEDRFWILLGYTQVLGAKAFEEAIVPEIVRIHLNRHLAEIPKSRLLLFRQPPGEPITLIVAQPDAQHAALHTFHLDNYSDLLQIDFSNLAKAEIKQALPAASPSIWVVCTNGRRDPCCAQWGQPLYHSLESLHTGPVFQSSHLGGHRFAANAVCFPDGIYYGRLRASDASNLLAASRDRIVLLDHYRGRVYYPPAAQAAEYYLRAQTGNLDIDAYQLAGFQRALDLKWLVHFSQAQDKKRHVVEIEAVWSEFENFESCSKPESHSRRLQYQVNRITAG
jgi:hypothetical protein